MSRPPNQLPLTSFLCLPVNMQAMCFMGVLEKVHSPLVEMNNSFCSDVDMNFFLPSEIKSVNTVNRFSLLYFI